MYASIHTIGRQRASARAYRCLQLRVLLASTLAAASLVVSCCIAAAVAGPGFLRLASSHEERDCDDQCDECERDEHEADVQSEDGPHGWRASSNDLRRGDPAHPTPVHRQSWEDNSAQRRERKSVPQMSQAVRTDDAHRHWLGRPIDLHVAEIQTGVKTSNRRARLTAGLRCGRRCLRSIRLESDLSFLLPGFSLVENEGHENLGDGRGDLRREAMRQA